MKTVLCVGSVTTDIIVTPADTIPTPGTLRSVDSVSAHVAAARPMRPWILAKSASRSFSPAR